MAFAYEDKSGHVIDPDTNTEVWSRRPLGDEAIDQLIWFYKRENLQILSCTILRKHAHAVFDSTSGDMRSGERVRIYYLPEDSIRRVHENSTEETEPLFKTPADFEEYKRSITAGIFAVEARIRYPSSLILEPPAFRIKFVPDQKAIPQDALALRENRLQCPFCTEPWEVQTRSEVVTCPNCKKPSRDPRFEYKKPDAEK
jgi:hypothetical protein